ncbi:MULTISPECIES: hypothetical protein [unclassified Nocardia]|uniref:hypothetical protein n=1 Tax=unclassified Nocardia TaxID=2637762 RepID=UPI001CE3BCAE|nr:MULTISPECIES: hypothetical protein [unclassified Nocardia]
MIVGGGIGLRGSGSAESDQEAIRARLHEEQFQLQSGADLVLLVKSSGGALNPTAVASIASQVRTLPNVRSAGSGGNQAMMNRDKSAAVIPVEIAGEGDGYRAAKAAVADAVPTLDTSDGATVTVLGAAAPPSWRAPVGWAATGGGAAIVFVSGALAFAGSRRGSGFQPAYQPPMMLPPTQQPFHHPMYSTPGAMPPHNQ